MKRAALVVLWLAACGGDDEGPMGAGGAAGAGAACAPGTLSVDGGCVEAGVPACAAGFELADDGGCSAVLPASCPDGQLALPGETSCHEVAPCADGRWGDIPVDATTQFVDAAYTVGDGDGSQLKPWPTITEAVAAAVDGAVVAIAEGTYPEAVVVSGKAITLWGRCPSLVEIVGPSNAIGTIDVRPLADGTTVRGLAITGAHGVSSSGSEDLVLEQLWIHDTADGGIHIEDTLGPTAMSVRGVLVERTRDAGVLAAGSSLTLDASVVRGTSGAPAVPGRGVNVEASIFGAAMGTGSITGSIVEASEELGIFAIGAELVVETTLIRDNALSTGMGGIGIGVEHDAAGGHPARLTVRDAVIERNQLAAAFVNGANAIFETTTIRDSLPAADGRFGRGIHAQLEPMTSIPAEVEVRRSLVTGVYDMGVFVSGAQATIELTRVAGTKAQSVDGLFGDGLGVVAYVNPARVALLGTRIETSARAGVSNFGGSVRVEACALECNAIDLDGEAWQGASYVFEAVGENACGCAAPAVCKAVSTGLAPPQQLGP